MHIPNFVCLASWIAERAQSTVSKQPLCSAAFLNPLLCTAAPSPCPLPNHPRILHHLAKSARLCHASTSAFHVGRVQREDKACKVCCTAALQHHTCYFLSTHQCKWHHFRRCASPALAKSKQDEQRIYGCTEGPGTISLLIYRIYLPNLSISMRCSVVFFWYVCLPRWIGSYLWTLPNLPT